MNKLIETAINQIGGERTEEKEMIATNITKAIINTLLSDKEKLILTRYRTNTKQDVMAQKLNISQAQLSRIEQERKPITEELSQKINEMFNKTI